MDYDMVHMVVYSESRDHLSRLKWFWHVPKMDSDSYTGQRILEIGNLGKEEDHKEDLWI